MQCHKECGFSNTKMSFLGLVLVLLGIGCKGTQKCIHEYRYGNMVIKYGRRASVTPDRDVYYPDDVVRFRCPTGYKFQSPFYSHHQEMWIKCLKDHRWLEDWPICRGPLENVTCENRYHTAESHGRSWLNQTVNEFHAIYYPEQARYKYGMTLRFTCPKNSKLFRTKGLTVMTIRCLKDGEWSREWPMCKGRTCKSKYVKNGVINDENKKLSVGVQLDIHCKPGYYLWGRNRTKCLETLEWSGYPQECITMEKFRKNCEMDKRILKVRFEADRKIPYCYYKRIESSSNHYKIAVGISVPMAIGFIIFIVTASLYVRHQRIKMSRERTLYIRQQHLQNRLLSSLPSYEEAVKSIPNVPPPTFEETFASDLLLSSENNLLLSSEETPSDNLETVDLPPRYNENSQIDLPPAYVEATAPPLLDTFENTVTALSQQHSSEPTDSRSSEGTETVGELHDTTTPASSEDITDDRGEAIYSSSVDPDVHTPGAVPT